jgi:TM2 domain-containing membrane protein YozV
MKNKIVAFLLAWFLGGIGVHKFYLGQTGWGIIYLLFCWTFIPSIAAFVEGIIYLTMSDAKFDQLYNGGQAQVLDNHATARDQALALQELKKLYEDGVITEGEYEQKRKKLLDRI